MRILDAHLAIFFLYVHLCSVAQAECPDWIHSPDIMQCPAGDNTMLPDTYPAIAQVVSDNPGTDTAAAASFTGDFVVEALKASGNHLPMMILPVKEKTFEEIKNRIAVSARSPEEKEKWLKTLVFVPDSRSYTWQQDYFESFINPDTGQAVIRNIDPYTKSQGVNSSKLINSAQSSCSELSEGIPLLNLGYKVPLKTMMGGNIEALPGGLCLHGNNQSTQYAAQYCGKDSNQTVIDTSWLTVGHVDEIISTVPNPKESAPCNFAITVASPDKALGLLKQNQNSPFFAAYNPNIPSAELTKERTGHSYSNWSAESWLKSICEKKSKLNPPNTVPGEDENKINGSAASILWHIWENTLQSSSAYAGIVMKNTCDFSNLSNAQIAQAIENDDKIKNLNKLIQIKMNEAKDIIRDKLKERLPQCKVQFIDMPDLFYTDASLVENPEAAKDAPIEKRFSLPRDSVDSILPNPTNQVVFENKILYSHPQNIAFNEYMQSSYKQLGLNSTPIDTFDYAHVMDGNLHCSTHTIRFCRPVEKVGP